MPHGLSAAAQRPTRPGPAAGPPNGDWPRASAPASARPGKRPAQRGLFQPARSGAARAAAAPRTPGGRTRAAAQPAPPRTRRPPPAGSSTTPQNWPFCASRPTADLPPRRGSLRDRTDTLEPAGDATQNALPLPAAADEVLRERARDAPCHQRVRRVHQLEMQVRGGRVAGMADPPDHLPGTDLLAPAHRDKGRAGPGVFLVARLRVLRHAASRCCVGLRPDRAG